MGSGREGSPAGGGGGAMSEKSSASRFAMRGTRWGDLGTETTTINLPNGREKEVGGGGIVASRGEALMSSSPHRRSSRAIVVADVAATQGGGGAESGDNIAVVKSSRRGPTRSNSAAGGSSLIVAMEVEAVGGNTQEARLGRQETCWSASTGSGTTSNIKAIGSRGGIGVLSDRESLMADVRGKSPRPSRVVEFSELQDQTAQGGLGRLSRTRTVKSPTRRIKTGITQEIAQEQALEPSTRSQSRLRDSKLPRSRGGSPKRTEEDDLQDLLASLVHEQVVTPEKPTRTRTSSKSTRQSSRMETQELIVNEPASRIPEPPTNRSIRSPRGEVETQGEIQAKAAARRARSTRRHVKKKTDEAHDPVSEGVPEPTVPDHLPSARAREPRQASTRMPKARDSGSTTPSPGTWMQLFGDVVMWKDVPRSTLFFGAGCFGIMSTSYVKSTTFGAMTFTCYLALIYLAGVYCHRSFLGGSQVEDGVDWKLSDAEALDMVRVVLPAVNLVISKCRQLFYGDPYTTLKVAGMLWVLAQLGHWMSLWSFARLAFIAVFTVPKLFSYYSHQLQAHAEAVAERIWTCWEDYSHKKAAILGAFLVTWNFTSASTRLFGAFVTLVAVRAYFSQFADADLAQTDRHVRGENHEEEVPAVIPPLQEMLPCSYPSLKEVKMEPS